MTTVPVVRRDRLSQAGTVLAALALAVLLTATGGSHGPVWARAAGPIVVLAGLVVLGRAAGWPAVPIMTICIILAGAAGSALLYDHQADVPPDNRVSGMDEIGMDPLGVVILLPAVWIVLALAVATRRWGGGGGTATASR